MTVSQQHNILRLNVPMHNTLVMGVLQRTQNLRSKVQGVIPGDGPLLLYIFL